MKPVLSDEEIRRFHEEGYVAVPALAEPGEIPQLGAIFDRLFSEGAGWREGFQYDLAGTDETKAKLPQIINPIRFAPELGDMPVRQRALQLARELLGPEAVPLFEHAILKPPRQGAATPWHQDEAHRSDVGLTYEQISIWIPLREATEANGCMRYIPTTHRGPVLPHHSPGDDPRIMALECRSGFDSGAAVPCPLAAGGAAVHDGRTLHAAGPNTSEVPRPAYILAFRSAMREEPSFQGYPWNLEKRTAAQQRAQSWHNRGGLLGRGSRRALHLAASTLRRVRTRARTLLG